MKHFDGWVPARIKHTQSGFKVDWCYLGDVRFTDPFFRQTIGQCPAHPAGQASNRETPIEALQELSDASPGIAPTGFIFHMSRCGSTLLSQMLAALPENIVISEAEPIDDVLRSHLHSPDVAESQRITWLRLLLNALGQRRFAAEKHLFVKFDSWHTLCLPLIQRAFPDVPSIFLYREPVEVLVSHHLQIGGQMIPGMLEPAFFGWDPQSVIQMDRSEYGAQVLRKICDAALEQTRTGRGKLVNYLQLPDVMWRGLADYWGVDHAPEAIETMSRACQFQAKNPALPFTDDTEIKKQAATDEIRQIARKWLGEVYRDLEARRLKQTA